MKMKGVRSLREMTRLLDVDQRLRKLPDKEKGSSVFEKRSQQVHPQGRRRQPHQNNRGESCKAPERNDAKDVDAVLDASFIKAWGTWQPLGNKKGLSDGDARVGRAGRTFGLGYKLHLSIDSQTMLPLTCTFASANQNEKKHSLNMLEKTKQILKRSAATLRSVIET